MGGPEGPPMLSDRSSAPQRSRDALRSLALRDRRASLAEAGRLLEGMRELEHAPLVLMTAHDLNSHR